jgi:uncharacterized protein (TIGR00369 family)
MDRPSRLGDFFGTYADELGVRLESDASGWPICKLDIRPTHLNRAQVVHGGVLFTLGDTAMGTAANLVDNAEGDLFLSSDVHIRYVRSVRDGALLARGRIEAKTRSTRITSCEIVPVDGGEIVAVMTGQFRRRGGS